MEDAYEKSLRGVGDSHQKAVEENPVCTKFSYYFRFFALFELEMYRIHIFTGFRILPDHWSGFGTRFRIWLWIRK